MGFIELRFDGTADSPYKVEITSGAIDRPKAVINKSLPPFAFKHCDAYHQNYQQLCTAKGRIALKSTGVQNAADLAEISSQQWVLAKNLSQEFHTWLQPISAEIQRQLQNFRGDLQVRIPTECRELRKLPWHLWNVLPAGTEVVFTDINAESRDRPHRDRIRILAILGDSTGIDVTADRAAIEQYCGSDAEVVFLDAPQRGQLIEKLADRQGWDILFFSGHSETEQTGTGRISINEHDSLTMAELEESLKPAIEHRLQIAIFNSCDGLGITSVLEKHNISQVVVMKEPIPDRVAQDFLKTFLRAFTKGARFDRAVNIAREKLKKLEADHPCASWLPVIIQNRLADSPTWQSLGKIRSPYKGLAAFTEQDAEYFYGREDFVAQLAEQVARQPLVAVIGASGSGKSSVVQAGLLPLLRKRSGGAWQILALRPGRNPFEALAKVLLSDETLGADAVQKLALALEGDRTVLTHCIAKIRNGQRVLLFVDQFEEVFTQSENHTCQQFLQALAYAVKNTADLTLLFTLRNDFVATMQSDQQDSDFRKLLEKYSPQLLCGMTRDLLEAAIRQPAERLGVKFEKGLVEKLLGDVGTNDSSLPLLQFVLEKLWVKQEPRLLTYRGYVEICGGSQNINSVLANYAEKIYADFLRQEKNQTISYVKNPNETWRNWLLKRTTRQNKIHPKWHRFKQVLLYLVTIGENAEDTRRVATRSEIGEENWRDIVTVLADQRLVVTNRHHQTKEETVEIIHESIIQHWQWLKQWIDQSRSELTTWREIEAATQKWNYNHQSKNELWKGKKLVKAKELQKNEDSIRQLSSPAKNFINASSEQQFIDRLRLWEIGVMVISAVANLAIPSVQKTIEIEKSIQEIEKSSYNECPGNAIRVLIKYNYEFKNIRNNLNGRNLSCASFDNANLENANLRSANLKGVNFQFSNLKNADFTYSNLINADFRHSVFNDVYLTNADVEGANLNEIRFATDNELRYSLHFNPYTFKRNFISRLKTAKNWEKAKYDSDFYR
jgi:energy-coupling factor transporter ATP-binding protein EcfA2